jgi:hypothetical protein
MKWNCWNGPGPLGHSLPGPTDGAFRPEAEAGESLPSPWHWRRTGQIWLACAREASDRAPFKRCLRLTSGPRHFFDLWIGDFLISKFHQILQANRLEHSEQLHFLYQVQNPKGLKVINSGINSNLNVP